MSTARPTTPSFGSVVGAGFLGGVIAWLVATGAYLLGRWAGLALEFRTLPDEPIGPIPLPAFGSATILPGLLAGVLAGIVRRHQHGRRFVWLAGAVVLVASLAMPMGSPLVQPAEVPWVDRLLMAGLHVAVYAIVLTAISRTWSRRRQTPEADAGNRA